MILLDSEQILSAVRRSLEQNVLPKIDDGFAEIQVLAAMKALDEVVDRLANGDPCIAVNGRMEERLAHLADELRAEAPAVAERIEDVLAGLAGIDDPRERNWRLGDGLTDLLARDDPGSGRIRQLVQEEAGRTAVDDTVWMCAEAIESLQ